MTLLHASSGIKDREQGNVRGRIRKETFPRNYFSGISKSKAEFQVVSTYDIWIFIQSRIVSKGIKTLKSF